MDTVVWQFKCISAHQGPLSLTDVDYKGSRYNVTIEWENGEITAEPLSVIAADDPVTCAIYPRENNLLDTPGWKQFNKLARHEKKFLRMVNQAKLWSYRRAKKYKFGFEVARDYDDVVRIDTQNKNTKCQDVTKLEMQQLKDYNAFKDHGHRDRGGQPPPGFKKIHVHLVFDVKHDG